MVGESLTICSKNNVTEIGEFRPESPCCAGE